MSTDIITVSAVAEAAAVVPGNETERRLNVHKGFLKQELCLGADSIGEIVEAQAQLTVRSELVEIIDQLRDVQARIEVAEAEIKSLKRKREEEDDDDEAPVCKVAKVEDE